MLVAADPDRDPSLPTPERAARGDIERAKGPVKADPGDYIAPHIAIDLLESLLNRKSITKDEKLAGTRFRAWFRLAQLDQLKASDPARVIVQGLTSEHQASFRVEHARNQIAKAIRWLGGPQSSASSCVWHVLGLELSLRRWNRETGLNTRRVSDPGASTVLVMALERLARMPWRGPFEEKS